MSLSSLLSGLLSDSDQTTESPVETGASESDAAATTVIHECRNCGTNVSAETTRCPACDGDDIVTYSID
ncbi:hypothetical protein [Halopiger djelfimassiliensis]|uniref:hypothetical protein n=1 Tax=Halopiger djelfimassiliensis TaxID=1293047 RepID=UPI000677EF07|nr:hypothetical protein [Halopiger djelfimassiliensis]